MYKSLKSINPNKSTIQLYNIIKHLLKIDYLKYIFYI